VSSDHHLLYMGTDLPKVDKKAFYLGAERVSMLTKALIVTALLSKVDRKWAIVGVALLRGETQHRRRRVSRKLP